MFGPFSLTQEDFNSRLKLTGRRQSLPNDIFVQARRLGMNQDKVELKVQHGQDSHVIDLYLTSRMVLDHFQVLLNPEGLPHRQVLSIFLPDYHTKLILSQTVSSQQQRTHLIKLRGCLFPDIANEQKEHEEEKAAKRDHRNHHDSHQNKENQDSNVPIICAKSQANPPMKQKSQECPLRSDALLCDTPFVSPIKSNPDGDRNSISFLDNILEWIDEAENKSIVDLTQSDDCDVASHEIRQLCALTQLPMTQRPAVKNLEEDISHSTSNIRTLSKESSGYTPQAKRSTKNKVSPQTKVSQQSSKSPPQQSNNLMKYFMANKIAEVSKNNSFYGNKNENPAPVAQRALSFAANRNEDKKTTATSRPTTSSSNGNVARNLIADPLYSTEASVELSLQQRHILDRCINSDKEDDSSNNIFYTGGGGTGKSLLLKQIISKCVEKYGASSVFVTATTGLAACAIGGSTIHQFLGIPAIDEEESSSEWESLFNQVTSRKGGTMHRAMQAKVLIIDEVSMLGPKLFEFLDRVLRKLRNIPMLPMGDVQIICCGDFFQLPPVSNKGTIVKSYQVQSSSSSSSRYCFQANCWSEVFPLSNCFELQQVYRQAADSEYVSILNDIRIGKWSMKAQQMLQECVGKPLHNVHGIMPTIIFTHKRDVDNLNQEKLKDLPGESMIFQAKDNATEKQYLNALQKNCPAKEKLTLKIGAQVILVKTIVASSCYGGNSNGLVNGARGIVVRFNRETKTPVVKFTDGSEHTIFNASFAISVGGRVVAERSQLPLDLAWGISVHKAQGMSVDQAELHLKNAFETGQVYVALSRVRSREGLSLKTPITMQQIRADPIVVEFYQTLAQRKEVQYY